MKDNHSHYYALFQICEDQTSAERLQNEADWLISLNQYINENSAISILIYEIKNSISVSFNRTAVIWRWVQKQEKNKIIK